MQSPHLGQGEIPEVHIPALEQEGTPGLGNTAQPWSREGAQGCTAPV